MRRIDSTSLLICSSPILSSSAPDADKESEFEEATKGSSLCRETRLSGTSIVPLRFRDIWGTARAGGGIGILRVPNGGRG